MYLGFLALAGEGSKKWIEEGETRGLDFVLPKLREADEEESMKKPRTASIVEKSLHGSSALVTRQSESR